ncbi:MAG TPA: GNAT family N-acetyltransferase [Streptosporangiaceae bacterium]
MTIRKLGADELARVQSIELASGRVFADIGMAEIADEDPPTLDTLAAYQAGGRAWVTAGDDGTPIAFVLVDVIDGGAHIEQISVHPGSARRGVGAELIAHVADWARDRGLTALTLTTFVDVPWNAPYYARLGFRAVPDTELSPGLRAVRTEEGRHGLDRWPRTAMRREL